MTELALVGCRVARSVQCPYCRHSVPAVCRRPTGYETLQTCTSCGGVFVVRFRVAVTASTHDVQGEKDRIADEQRERLELERGRAAAEASA